MAPQVPESGAHGGQGVGAPAADIIAAALQESKANPALMCHGVDTMEAAQKFAAATMRRATSHNFNAGPAHVPTNVMVDLCCELMSFKGTGIGVHEMSHRDAGGHVQQVIEALCNELREVLAVPDTHDILVMQGGAHQQFAAVPLNLLGRAGDGPKEADYINGGFWSERACGEAKKYCQANLVEGMRTNAAGELEYIPPSEWKLSPNAQYVHICANETINGLEFLEDPDLPESDRRPLVGDFTSTLLSRPVNVARYGCIYASGGKNLGPSGVAVVIVRKDLIGCELPICPSMMSYAAHANTQPIANIYNTPPLFTIRGIHLSLRTVYNMGGLEGCATRAKRISKMFYEKFAASEGFYTQNVAEQWRTRMTIPFSIKGGTLELEKKFTKLAMEQELDQVFGHPVAGGLRACVYNSLPESSAEKLLNFMDEFRAAHA